MFWFYSFSLHDPIHKSKQKQANDYHDQLKCLSYIRPVTEIPNRTIPRIQCIRRRVSVFVCPLNGVTRTEAQGFDMTTREPHVGT